jgi:hypothetical protein
MASESWDCLPNRPSNGGRGSPSTGVQPNAQENFAPCFVALDSLFDGDKFPTLERGEISASRPPRSNEPCDRPTPPAPGSLQAGCDVLGGSPYRTR